MTDPVRPRRALLSVSDKAGLVELGQGLAARGVALLSTGNSAAALRGAGLAVTDVAEATGSPEKDGGPSDGALAKERRGECRAGVRGRRAV